MVANTPREKMDEATAQVQRTGLHLYTTLGAIGYCTCLRRGLAALSSRQPA